MEAIKLKILKFYFQIEYRVVSNNILFKEYLINLNFFISFLNFNSILEDDILFGESDINNISE
jgi:hypothetical protein